MAGFFQRLAGRTLGMKTPVAQPIVPSVFVRNRQLAPAESTDFQESQPVHREPRPPNAVRHSSVSQPLVVEGAETLLVPRLIARNQDASLPAPVRETIERETLKEPVRERIPRNTLRAPPDTRESAATTFSVATREVRAVTPPVRAETRRPSLAATREPSQSAAFEAAPVIRVSIGRVEVRAVFPPAVPSARANRQEPSPALSLEQYRRQRDGGLR